MMNGHMSSLVNGYGNGGINGIPAGMSQFGQIPYFSFSSLVFLALIAFGLFLLFKRRNTANLENRKSPVIEAVELVKLRYARGEITFDEFQSIVKTIQS